MKHAERCRELISSGEDWRGRTGHATLARAVVLASEGSTDAADAAFREAQETFQRQRLRVDEAEALHQHGRALVAAGDGVAAAERLDRAFEVYRGYGAGEIWLNRVDADRRRLGAQTRAPSAGGAC